MNYYVITDITGSNKGVILHDYAKGYFSVHSISDVLQLAIDSAVKVLQGFRIVKSSDNVAKVLNFDANSTFWASDLIKKVVDDSSYWKVSEKGKLSSVEIDSFLEKILH